MLKQLYLSAVVLGLASSAASASPSKSFAAGSLIIPGGSAYQDDCGVVSRFGLVYDLLRAEPYFALQPQGPLHIYYIINSSKGSPNRCVPAWKTASPAQATPTASGWDDGCDLKVPNALTAPQPVKLVDLAGGGPDITLSTINTVSKASGGNPQVYPGYANTTIDTTVTMVGYLGAPFVIDVADAARVLAVIEGAPVATDASGALVDFSAFRAPGGCTYGNTHHVNIHRATTGFNAEVNRDFYQAPPRLALVAKDVGHVSTKLYDNILEDYLKDAGLTFTGAQGCPIGGKLNGMSVCGSGNSSPCCGSPVKNGVIFDLFDVQDVMNDRMSDMSGTYRLYPMVWAPHWESGSGDASAFTKMNTYLNSTTGFMGECGSISTFEGAFNGGGADIKAGLQLQTCQNDGTGNCAATTTQYGIQRSPSVPSQGTNVRNCTDPNMASSAACMYFGYPADPFAQPGDYSYTFDQGHVTALIPLATTSSIYKPGVQPLISYVASLDKTKLGTVAASRGMVIADVQTRNLKDNDPTKANVIYIGGHDQTGNASGTQLVLETLLQLGAAAPAAPPPITVTEVSRSAPVVATITGQTSVVQGSFSSLSTPLTPLLVALPVDLVSWVFPTVGGHMRARTTASIGTSASSFGSSTILFDAANGIPPATPSGCASNFTTTCRTVFTTVDTPVAGVGYATALRPTLHFFKDAEALTIGQNVISGGIWAVAGWTTLLSRVLAGDPSGGTYAPKLGGVDHSTAAVIEPSTLANGSRPTMLYFGANDGMLHAYCADNTTGACNGGLGKELWAFIPRTQLPYLVSNTAKVDSSPRVMDMFGDFQATGTKAFHTLMWFTTTNSDATAASKSPSVFEMDISDPAAPKLVWEYTVQTPGTPAAQDLGNGLTVAAGVVSIGGVNRNVVWVQTNNGNAASSAGIVVDAIDADTGVRIWRFAYTYPAVHLAGDIAVPKTGLPGGVVVVDRTGQGFITDVTFGDLYGNFWVLDPVTGVSRYTTNKPLFQYSTDYHPIGSAPTIYSNGGSQFAVLVPGGFVDPLDSAWGSATQTVVSVSLGTPNVDATLTEASSAPDVPFKITLGAGEKSFAQAVVVGGQLFITTDTADVNSSTYGTAGNTGKVYAYTIASGTQTTTAVSGGSSSIANNGTEVYVGSSAGQQRLGADALSTVGAGVDVQNATKVSRLLWLRTI